MELLERYLNQIKKHLPFKDKEDTINELRSLILEELDSKSNGHNDEELLYEIIKRYGYPYEVAAKYRDTDPLISSSLRPFLYTILKIVSFAIPLGIFVSTIVGFIDNDGSFSLLDLLLEVAYSIPSIINALIMGYGFVFIIFILIEKYAKEGIKNEIPDFEPKSLPLIPKDNFKISNFEEIFTVLMGVLILYLINYHPGLISIYLDNVRYPLLNDNFIRILPLINFSLLFAIAVGITYIVMQRKTHITVTLDLIQTIFSGVILILLASNDIFNEIIINGHNLNVVPNITSIVMYIGGVGTIIGGVVSYLKIILKGQIKKVV